MLFYTHNSVLQLTEVNNLLSEKLNADTNASQTMKHYTQRHQAILSDYCLEYERTQVRGEGGVCTLSGSPPISAPLPPAKHPAPARQGRAADLCPQRYPVGWEEGGGNCENFHHLFRASSYRSSGQDKAADLYLKEHEHIVK